MPPYSFSGAPGLAWAQITADQALWPSATMVEAVATVAPTKPPIRACEEEEGRPDHQVSKFQMIAPKRAEMMVAVVTKWLSTKPDEIVAATLVPTSAPMRSMEAARVRAMRGESARVETPMAMELAVSWKPL